MHGVPLDLPLKAFVGDDFSQIAIGQHQIQLRSSNGGRVSIEADWSLDDEHGNTVDSDQEHTVREHYRLHKIIGVVVSGFEINAPLSCTLRFENSWTLTLYDSNDHYESFSIEPKGEPGVHV